MRFPARWDVEVMGVALWLAAGACDNSIGPENRLDVASDSAGFRFHAEGLDDVSQVLWYRWMNPWGAASVTRFEELSAGMAAVLVRDAEGARVYDRVLDHRSFMTGGGVAGEWTIEIRLRNASGSLGIRVRTGYLVDVIDPPPPVIPGPP
jgi:hypothetical protein